MSFFRRIPSRLGLLGIAAVLCLVSYSWIAGAPRAQKALLAPSVDHWFGTDSHGYDLLHLVAAGASSSLGIGLLAALLAVGIGTVMGAFAGFYRGQIEQGIVRVTDVLLSFPLIVVLLALRGLTGSMSAALIVIVFAALRWTDLARMIRAEVLRSGLGDFVLAAEALGFSTPRILWLHVLPQAVAPSLVAFPLFVAAAITVEATLGFLGLGISAGLPSWGALLAQSIVHRSAWWLAVFPGAAIFLCIASFSLLSETLRDFTDPRLRFSDTSD